MSAKLVWTFVWNVTGVFWSVVSVPGLPETVSTLAALPLSATASLVLPAGFTVMRPVVTRQRQAVRGVERFAADGRTSRTGPEVHRAARGGDAGPAREIRRRARATAGRAWPTRC